jgi:hypothetical protein
VKRLGIYIPIYVYSYVSINLCLTRIQGIYETEAVFKEILDKIFSTLRKISIYRFKRHFKTQKNKDNQAYIVQTDVHKNK